MKSTVERMEVEELLKILGEKSPFGVCIIQDGKFCYINPSFPLVTGYMADELTGRDSLTLIAPEDREMVKESAIKMLKGELTSPYQFMVVCKDGSIKWVMETVRSIQYRGRQATLGNYMDITKYKQAEEALKENEERYRELANSITDIFFAMDEHLRYTYWNKASEILTGIRAEDAIGTSLLEIFPDTPETRKAEKVYRNVLRTRHPRTFVNDFNIDGRHYIFEISAYPARGGISVFVKDITEHKQAEEALKDSEQRYRLIFETSLDCIVQMDREGRYLAANPATARSLGVPLEELIGKTVFEVMPQKVAQHRLRMLRKALNEWQPRIFEDKRAGRYFHHIVIPTKTSDQKEVVQVITRDITERRQTEEALRQSEENYRALFDSAVIGTIVMDAGTMKVMMANQAAAEMLGLSYSEELIGVDALANIPLEEKESVRELMAKELFEQDLRQTREFRMITKDGREIWISANAARIIHEGKLAGLASFTDITERKQAVEALRQSEERYRTILEEMEDAYFEVDLGGHFTFVNNSVCRDLGYSREELMGMSYKKFTVEEDIESVFRVFNEVYQTGVPNKGFPWRTTRKDGSHGFVETSVSPLRNDKGEIIGFRGVGRDITERKKTEEELNLQKARFQQLFDNSPDAIIMVDIDDRLIHANKGFEALFGYSAEELQGRSIRKLIVPEEDAQATPTSLQRVFSGEVVRREAVRRHKDGSLVDVSILSYPIRVNDKVVGACFTYTDITQRRKVEEALRQSEENYKTLFDSAAIGMYVLDTETMKVVMGNRAAREMAGFKSEREGIGVNPFDFVVPEDREKVLEVAITDFLQDSFKPREIRVMDKDGRRGWISISSARIMHEGKLAALVSIMDITEGKQAEEALRQSEENYRALFDSSVTGTIVMDAETAKVIMANRVAAKMFGFSSAHEIIGVNLLDFVPPESKKRVLEFATKELFEQNSRRTYELRAITKDDREIWISITGARIMHEGRLAGLISFTDITEQKRQNEQLMMTDRLASLGELAAGTAHELNNPLTSIIGFSQLLIEKEVADDIRENLKLINNEAQRATSVTKNLLTFARKHTPKKQHNQINSIIEDVLKLRAYEHKADGIEVVRQLAPDLPEIMVEYFQMQQVFLNIIINAEYFMTEAHRRGTLTITTKQQNNTMRISIADDGPGIPPENLRRIFDPFFTTKEAGKGTGLGLSICHGIVTEHGGQIYAKSQLDKGATIFVELPINDSDHVRSVL